MNSSHSKDDKTQGMPAGLKVVVLVCALGIIMTGVYHFHAQPAEALVTPVKATFVPPQAPAMSAVSLAASFEGTAMSTNSGGSTTSPSMVAQRTRLEQPAVALTPRMYSESGSEAIGDGDNHPPSF